MKHLEPVSLSLGQVLHEPGGPIRHVYFPCDGVVSVLSLVGPHKAVEVGMVGNEGIVGISAAFGITVSYVRTLVQGDGTAMKMSASRLHEECATNDLLNHELLRFSHALMVHASQTAVCNRFHDIPSRLARWLLLTRDRLYTNNFKLTHHLLSVMLGVQRVGVTIAASGLEKRGLITYSRGNIQILNRKGLESAACMCYGVVKSAYARMYGPE